MKPTSLDVIERLSLRQFGIAHRDVVGVRRPDGHIGARVFDQNAGDRLRRLELLVHIVLPGKAETAQQLRIVTDIVKAAKASLDKYHTP